MQPLGSMRIHHLNCVSACPLGGHLMDGLSGARLRGRLTSHCLLLETNRHLVLVDTGYGLRDVQAPRSRLSRVFLALNRPLFREEMTAIRQIERMGFDPRDVQHIVLTHLDFDHAGGLDDFPGATVHMLAQEREAAEAQATVLDRMRYRPSQWGTRAQWRVHRVDEGMSWMGLPRVPPLGGITDDVVMVPLIGHTLGHCGVAVRDARGAWLLLAGDAYFYFAEMDRSRPRCTPGLAAYQTLMEKDRAARLDSQRRLRALLADHPDEVRVICSHDVTEFEACSGRDCEELPPLVRMTRNGVPILDEGDDETAPPRAQRGEPVLRPARPHA
jgi:glyoxylase-like metal-dependent hydrolase (beta-lactamase superfamily II)